jgi:hypothetical protein
MTCESRELRETMHFTREETTRFSHASMCTTTSSAIFKGNIHVIFRQRLKRKFRVLDLRDLSLRFSVSNSDLP